MNDYADYDDYSRYSSGCCRHMNPYDECDECDAIIEENGGIDKCLNCGRYKSGNQLNRDQVCIKGCRNPNEY